VDVFPVVALASTLMLPLLVRPKLGVGAAVTVTVFVPVALL
jgi:hypothetical protein